MDEHVGLHRWITVGNVTNHVDKAIFFFVTFFETQDSFHLRDLSPCFSKNSKNQNFLKTKGSNRCRIYDSIRANLLREGHAVRFVMEV